MKTKSNPKSKSSATRKKPISNEATPYHQAICAFGSCMLAELMSNQRKGDFLKWRPGYQEALNDLDYHVKKLDLAMLSRNPGAVTEHCADIANICVAIHRAQGLSADEFPPMPKLP
jgi:hypothetical protein